MAADWYKRTPRDFIDGVIGLSLEEVGAYSIVLDLIYLHSGPIRHDTKWLSGLFQCSTRKAGALIERLVAAGKLTLEDGRIGNRRASVEMQVRAVSDQVHAKNGKKGGELAAENRRRANENSDLGLPPKVPDKIREEENRDRTPSLESESPREGLFGNDAPEVPPPDSLLADVMEEMGMYTVPADAGDMLKRWRQEGCDPKEHILPAIKRVMERVRYRGADRPVRLAYFHRAVIEERDREAAELAEYKARMQAITARYSKPADERVH